MRKLALLASAACLFAMPAITAQALEIAPRMVVAQAAAPDVTDPSYNNSTTQERVAVPTQTRKKVMKKKRYNRSSTYQRTRAGDTTGSAGGRFLSGAERLSGGPKSYPADGNVYMPSRPLNPNVPALQSGSGQDTGGPARERIGGQRN